MREILVRKRDIAGAVAQFRRAIAALDPNPRKAEWVFPSGARATLATHTLNTRGARLLAGLPARAGADGRVPHLLRLDRDDGGLTPDIELNIAPALDRKVSGVYVRDGKSTWLATRGSFTAYRGKIARGLVFRHFEKWLIDAVDGDEHAQVIPVAALDSATLAEDLADFVRAVITLKTDFRHGETSVVQTDWREGEGEGGSTFAQDNPHGPLCSALEARLLALTHMSARHKVCRNREIDAALVEMRTNRACAIFEVRAFIARGASLHDAVGRLLCHRRFYGGESALLCLVLPLDALSQVSVFKEIFMDADITVLARDGADFYTADGIALAQLLDPVLAR